MNDLSRLRERAENAECVAVPAAALLKLLDVAEAAAAHLITSDHRAQSSTREAINAEAEASAVLANALTSLRLNPSSEGRGVRRADIIGTEHT